jgi:outer membrane protein
MGKKSQIHLQTLFYVILFEMIISVLITTIPSSAPAQEKSFTLEECLGVAFENNLDISQAKKGQDEADFKLKQAQGRQYPQVDIDAMSGYNTDVTKMRIGDMTVQAPPPLGELTVPGKDIVIGEHEKADLSVALLQPIYTGGRIDGGIRAASAGLQGSTYQISLAKSQVRNQVIKGFYQLASAQEFKQIAVASRDQILSHLKDATNLLDQGMLLKSELLPIDIRRLDTELKIVQAENAIARAKASLAERMGLPPDKPVDIQVEWNRCPPWPIPQEILMSNPTRPEQQIALAQVEAAEAEADIATGGMRPQVGLTTSGHYGWPGFVATQPEWEPWWQAGVNVSWNIFDMDQRKNELSAALAKKSRLVQSKQSVDRQIELDRINSRLAYEEAFRKKLIAKEKVVSAQENFNTKEDNFKVGMANNTDYLDAHTELMNAKSELTVISAQVQTAWADYLRALGSEEWRPD